MELYFKDNVSDITYMSELILAILMMNNRLQNSKD